MGACALALPNMTEDRAFFNDECYICYEEEGELIALEYGHRFHSECLQGVRNNLCPYCGRPIRGFENHVETITTAPGGFEDDCITLSVEEFVWKYMHFRNPNRIEPQHPNNVLHLIGRSFTSSEWFGANLKRRKSNHPTPRNLPIATRDRKPHSRREVIT